jgi:hypothetical protein
MTRMMHLDRKYRVHLKKNLEESLYVDLTAGSADEAEDYALQLIDNKLMYHMQTISTSANAGYEIESIEEL